MMATYYVSKDGDGSSPTTDPGTSGSWASAYNILQDALTAASSGTDVILMSDEHFESLSAELTLTSANHVRVIVVDHQNTATLSVMDGSTSYIGKTSGTSYTINISGAHKQFWRGIAFTTSSSSSPVLQLGSVDGQHSVFENCKFWLKSTGGSLIRTINSTLNTYLQFNGCDFWFGASAQTFYVRTKIYMQDCTINNSGTAPSTLFFMSGAYNPLLIVSRCDLSKVTGTLVGDSSGVATTSIFDNCKLGSGVTLQATQSVTNLSSGTSYFYNCSAGDQHYQMAHHDAFGSTIIDTGIYANDGAQYDGTNYCSWKIVTTANCSFYTPYVSPWIDCYHSGTSAITPYLEILRDGSTTAYQDDEVWGEFSYQGTSGYPLSIIVDDRKGLLASAADQTAGVGTSGWTGDTGAWSGKLSPTASITPAEIGHLRARVCVGEPSITVYVCPTIRGRS